MRHCLRFVSATALLILLAVSPALAVKPADAIASGWVVSVNDSPSSAAKIEIGAGDQIRHEKFTADQEVILNGVLRYPKGGTYNAFHISQEGSDALIVWSGVDDAVLWNIDAAVASIGPENIAIQPGDRVEVRVKRNDEGELRVTVDVFRGKPSIAWFNFPLG